MPVDEHSAWPGAAADGRRRSSRNETAWYALTRAAYLVDMPVTPVDRPDWWLSTHTGVRPGRNRPSDAARETVHRIAKVVPADPGKCLAGVYVAGCGLIMRVGEAVRTGRPVTCGRIGCVSVTRIHERPETVVRPSGPCEGDAAKNKFRRDATGNGVAAPSDRDSLRSVKTPAVNRVSGHPRSQVATAGPATTGRTTSPARAGRPSEGEPRVLESVAAQALHPTARAGVPHERPSLPPADGDGPDGSAETPRSGVNGCAPRPRHVPGASPDLRPDRGEPPTHPALAASVMRAAVSSATGLPTVDLASHPCTDAARLRPCRGGVLPTNLPSTSPRKAPT